MPRVLVIDDDETVREVITTVLRNEGLEVIETGDGKEALKIQQQTPAQLIITDILMPDFDGIELIRKLRRDDPHLKIVAISGGGWSTPEQFLTMAERLGANASFSKPFRWNELIGTVKRLLASAD